MPDLSKYINELALLKEKQNYRVLPDAGSEQLIDLCSNDYLGLNTNKELHSQFLNELEKNYWSFSAASSRLLSGNSNPYNELESLLASWYGQEACLIFNSGYHANIGILPALTGKKDLIVADKLVHASLIDGAKLSAAEMLRYKHLDYGHLESILNKHCDKYENVFIVSESIFSMDGDISDLQKLAELKNKYNCFLYIDEAHALGVRGQNGLGCAEEQNMLKEIDFLVGTFGKAIASVGAFVVCKSVFKDYLVNHSRSLIFTTALPPVNLAFTKFVFVRLPHLSNERKRLVENSKAIAEILGQEYQSHIVPYVVGANEKAVALSGKFKECGYKVLPIRYPTVPKNKARLRFSLNAKINTWQLQSIKQIINANE